MIITSLETHEATQIPQNHYLILEGMCIAKGLYSTSHLIAALTGRPVAQEENIFRFLSEEEVASILAARQ